jgi:hypothetical protein
MLFKSPDRGATWTAISPDLTANVDRETLEMMGARVPEQALSRHDGVTAFSTLTTIGESPLDARLLYTGSDDGRLSVTRDGGQTWTALNQRISGLPSGTYVSSVLPSRYAAGRVYATFDGHYNDDYRAYAYVSDDYGQTWRSIVTGLPAASVHKLREHPRKSGLLFVAHERGIHFSIDNGTRWSPLNLNMPTVPVDDILIHPRDNDLIAGTHGRSIWILDNISSLEALTPDAMRSDAFLVPPARARLLSIYTPQAWYGAGQFFAPNPDFNAAIEYYVRAGGQDEVGVTIADAHGATVRRLTGSNRTGLNRASWDLRLAPPVSDAHREAPAPGGFGGPPQGPLVLPGVYTVTVNAAGRSLKGELRVEGDPRVAFSDADRRTRQTALLNLYALQKSLSTARVAGATAAGQLDTPGGKNLVSSRADTVSRLTQVQADLVAQFNAVTSLSRAIEGYSGLPTADQRRQLDWAFEDAGRAIDAMNRVLQTDTAPSRLTVPTKLTREE